MTVFLVCAAMIVVVAIGMWLAVQALDALSDGRIFSVWPVAALVWWAASFAVVVQASINEEKKGPCLHYATQMYWNAGTKTMMPARVCVERGEWVKP